MKQIDYKNSTTLEMNAFTGMPIYIKSTKELEEQGYLCPTKIFFIDMRNKQVLNSSTTPSMPQLFSEYQNEYNKLIVSNYTRNMEVVAFCNRYRETKKILVITKLINHSNLLGSLIPGSIVINGSTESEIRKEGFKEFKETGGLVLIGSAKIFSAGINIPDLDVIINCSGNKSDIDTIQITGRVKRLHPGKEFGYYIDFMDSGEYCNSASEQRMKLFEEYDHEVKMVRTSDNISI